MSIVDDLNAGTGLLQDFAGNQLIDFIIFHQQNLDAMQIGRRLTVGQQLLQELIGTPLLALVHLQHGVIQIRACDRLHYDAINPLGQRLHEQALFLMQTGHGNQRRLRPAIDPL